MYSLTRKLCLGSVAAGALAVSAASLPAQAADDFVHNLGPVNANDPILTTVGSKRVIAFYEANADRCGMNIVLWDRADVNGGSAARVRLSLDPRQTVQIDSPENKSLELQSGEQA